MNGAVMAPRVFAAPRHSINLEVTNRCVLNCFMCCQPLISKPRGFIDPRLVERIVTDISRDYPPAETRIQLIGQGEPLLHPQLPGLIRTVKRHGFRADFVTNAVLLDDERQAALAATPLDEIKISFYGWDADSYRTIHGSDCFAPTLRNIIRLLSRPRPFRVSLHLLNCRASAAVVARLERLWSLLPVDVACTYQVRNIRDTLAARGQENIEQPLPRHPRPVYSRMCFAQLPIIHWDGAVSPCVYDYDSQLTLGNVAEMPYGDIVRGPAQQRFLAAARGGHLLATYGFDPCARCSDADTLVGADGEAIPLPPPVVNNSATAGGAGGAEFIARHFPPQREEQWPEIFRELLFSPLTAEAGT